MGGSHCPLPFSAPMLDPKNQNVQEGLEINSCLPPPWSNSFYVYVKGQ